MIRKSLVKPEKVLVHRNIHVFYLWIPLPVCFTIPVTIPPGGSVTITKQRTTPTQSVQLYTFMSSTC